jgi:malonyl-CoA O-methyltransferase
MNCKVALSIDKIAVKKSFSKAARHYDQFAQLQRDIGVQLLNTVNKQDYKRILDLGCGTGYFSEKILHRYPQSHINCLDLCDAMLAQVAKKRLVNVTCQQGDIDNLPIDYDRFDLIFSNLVLQWSEDLCACLKQLKGRLSEGGKLHFSTLLTGTLNELTQAWRTVDQSPHTNSFLDIDTISEYLQQCGFSQLSIKTETRIVHYDNVIAVMRALKGVGANHVHGHQKGKLNGRKLIKQLEKGYKPFLNGSGQLNLTYQVCYVEAQK